MSISEWISVKERMPEPRKAVLGYTPNGRNIFAVYRNGDAWYCWESIQNPLYREEVSGVITHWRLMPEPPKEDVV